MWKKIAALGVAGAVAFSVGTAVDAANKSKRKSKPPVPFTEEMMTDAARIKSGETIWRDQCQHCHGAKAYPGKAPKLRTSRYKPNFVYRRVTDGFKKMPAWDEVYSDEERMDVTIYILSDKFSP